MAVGCVACAGLRAVRIARNLGRREGILGEKGRQRSPGEYADRFHADTFARSGFEHKAEQFSHEQIWQKPERSLGRMARLQKAWDRRITPVPHGFSADRRRAEASAPRRAPAKRTGHKNRYLQRPTESPAARRATRSVLGVDKSGGAAPSPTPSPEGRGYPAKAGAGAESGSDEGALFALGEG